VATLTDAGSAKSVQTLAQQTFSALEKINDTFTAKFAGEDTGLGNVIEGFLAKARQVAEKIGLLDSTGSTGFGKGAMNHRAAGGFIGALTKLAAGGTFPKGGFANSERIVVAGESGREAVVPLQRPLALIDPSVRLLAAVAQGKVGVGGDTHRTVNIGSINSNSANAETVAQEALNLIFGRLI